MGDESDVPFLEDLLTEKLFQLNSSQESIESLSKWCLFYHGSRAKQVVEAWHTVFKSVTQERRVLLVDLAIAIMKNRDYTGTEFVKEFRKVNCLHFSTRDDIFSEWVLTEKLSKLESTQQSIETLSRWCDYHRKRAKRVVELWYTEFKSAPQERWVSLLYLANEIMKINRLNGGEFLNEFWKVLPTVLLGVFVNGGENCKKEASRLISIWSERKFFVSKGQNLLDELLGKKASPDKTPSPVNVGKNPNHIKVLKRDANCLRIDLAVGGLPEKILTAFQVALDKIANEEAVLEECRSAVSYVQGNLLGSDAVSDIQKQEDTLWQSICQLGYIESTRVALISQLREALQDQESKLAVIQCEMLTAFSEYENTVDMKLRLTSTLPNVDQTTADPGLSPVQGTNSPIPAPPTHPLTTIADLSDEEDALMSKRPRLDEPVISNNGMPPTLQQSQPQPQVPPAPSVYSQLVGIEPEWEGPMFHIAL